MRNTCSRTLPAFDGVVNPRLQEIYGIFVKTSKQASLCERLLGGVDEPKSPNRRPAARQQEENCDTVSTKPVMAPALEHQHQSSHKEQPADNAEQLPPHNASLHSSVALPALHRKEPHHSHGDCAGTPP
jgi:hypothetical protein